MKWILILISLAGSVSASTLTADSASYADVKAKTDIAVDGDIVMVPAGTPAAWTSGLTITKNIQLIGAGEGETIITSNTASSTALVAVNLDHEAAAPDYSFRMSGFTILSSNATTKPSGKAYITLSSTVVPPVTTYVHGCISRVRLDHMTWTNLKGQALQVDSVLGVADHITADNTNASGNPISKVFMSKWTPIKNPATDTALSTDYIASDAYGSWADDAYWGTNKFWFFEDCNFTGVNSYVMDDEEGGRVVYRHCTVTGGTTFASHGMEGRRLPGVRAREIYNNYFITSKNLAQSRSGGTLYFNNRSTSSFNGFNLKPYRFWAIYNMWGGASGDNRYDQNPADTTPIVTGTIAAVATPGSATTATVTVGASDDLSAVDLNDGSAYIIQDTDDPFTGAHNTFNGWKYNQSGISSIAGKVLSLSTGTSPDSAHWQVGHHYQIRKISKIYGAPGTGKGNLLNISSTTVSGYSDTFTYPATSGTLAVAPQAGYSLDPCYSWNNTDDANGYVGFTNTGAPFITSGVDYFNLSERTTETQSVGYPPVDYDNATSDYPDIGEIGDEFYIPYSYPHPLASDNPAGKMIQIIPTTLDFGSVVIGETATKTYEILSTGDATLTASNPSNPAKYTDDYGGGTIAAGSSVTVTVTYTPTAEETNSGTSTIASDADSGGNTVAVTGAGKTPAEPPPGDRAYGTFRKVKSILSHMFP